MCTVHAKLTQILVVKVPHVKMSQENEEASFEFGKLALQLKNVFSNNHILLSATAKDK